MEKAFLTTANERNRYRQQLVHYYIDQSPNERRFKELPYQLYHLGATNDGSLRRLYNTLSTDHQMVEHLYQIDRSGLLQYWRLLIDRQSILCDGLFTDEMAIVLDDHSQFWHFYRLTKVFYALSEFDLAHKMIQRMIPFVQAQIDPLILLKFSHLAVVEVSRTDYEYADRLLLFSNAGLHFI